jgi:crotonobetainyl-CoA:carnitine CoA-transferase CaiB-like acyl-CoA transferase
MTAGALSGIIVADFSRVLAGPLASQTLADLGADVIKIERPEGGDDTRQWGPPFVEEGSTYYLGLNRGKRSLTLDLKDPADQQLAHELCRRADVIFESFRPGTMDRLGLGWEAVRQYNPRAIYTSISAFGSSDEGAALPGYDLLVQAMSGYMSITGAADGPAMKPGTALIDLATGLYAATGTLAALQERERSGEGQHVEVALLDSALAMLLNVGSGFLNTGELPARTGNAHPSIAPYQTFPTATGDLALAVGNDAIFTRFCDAIGQPEIATDSRFATNSERVVHRDALIAILSEIFADESAEIWTERLTAAGVPAGPVNDVAQAYEFADALGLEPIVELEGVRSTRSPLRLSRTPAVPRSRPPRLGEHNDELRAWLSEG